MARRGKRDLARFVVGEAVAYAKTGVLSSTRAKVRKNATTRSPLGVVFVHGVGANSTQFRSLQRRLETEVDWFDAFEYNWARSLPIVARELRRHLDEANARCERLIVVGHSLGGLLLRMVLQEDDPVERLAGFVSICAPLHGTRLSKLSPLPSLRAITPDGELISRLHRDRERLDRYRERILTIGARTDHFVAPHHSALLDGHEQLELDAVGHVGALFDPEVQDTVAAFIRRVKRTSQAPEGSSTTAASGEPEGA